MTVTIIGLGLIGGSLALSLRQHGLAAHFVGVEQNPAHARRALELGLVDEVEPDLPAAVRRADLVVVAVPMDAMLAVLPQVLDATGPRQTVIDVGSTKATLLAAVAGHPRRGRFVATHPMAGTEYSGPDAAVLGLSGLQYFNVGSDTGSKMIDVIREITDIAGYDVPIEDLGERAGDVPATYASSAKLVAATSWRAEVGLREGLERTVAWFRAQSAK